LLELTERRGVTELPKPPLLWHPPLQHAGERPEPPALVKPQGELQAGLGQSIMRIAPPVFSRVCAARVAGLCPHTGAF
jgi:hypothetical protein